ncbi:MAG TPA: amidase [Gemmatimonadaceae bacterium]|nr:amidase [Gemmatimonadaceae bacterium]
MHDDSTDGRTPLSRRAFVGAALATGALAATTLAVPAIAEPAPDNARDATGDAPTAPFSAFALEEATIADLQRLLTSGQYTSRTLCQAYTARIAEIDRNGPALRSVIELNPDALTIADAMDAERRAGRPRGPLHGIPVLIKDNIATADAMQTTAGSLALVGVKPPRDSAVAAKLRAAGAVILGKTNLSEWANFRSTHSSSGWSGRGGQTRNPYALDRTPSGSSSGSGSAVAASLCAVAIGTETDGSVTSPAAAASLVGIKPTVGLVSRSGIVPISHTQDTAGPMTRTVTDAAILLGAIAGVDATDRATAAAEKHAVSDYTQFLDAGGLKGARIGVARKRYAGYHDATDEILKRSLDVMRAHGATIVDPADIPTAGKFGDMEFEVLLYEFKADLNAYLAEWAPGAPARTLGALIEWNKAHAADEMPYFKQEIMEMAEKKGSLSSAAYRKAMRAKLLAGPQGIDAVMKAHRLDALVAPTQGPAALTDLVYGDPNQGGSFTSPAAVAGYPHITVPAGFVFGLPVGISFVGGAWSEPTLLKLAYSFEQATKARRPPTFEPSATTGETRR